VDCVDLDALEQEARRVMAPPAWVFCDTGADDEITAKENVTAWRKLRLRPRMLRDIVKIDTSVSLLGAPAQSISPGG
jgi:isopentenyl diphosphate isomerase/L-lactate dehydrogenase-like FMN-dependent dehydrogenase